MKDAAGTVVNLDKAGSVTVAAAPPVISGVTVNKTSATVGDTLTWTASASGGSGILQYCFYVFKNGSVVERGSYGTAKTYSYQAAAAGTYTVRVYVKDSSGTTVSLDNAGRVTVSAAPPVISGVTVNKTSADVGDTITWTAAASGGSGTLQYCFYVFKDGSVTERGSYGTTTTYSYQPTAAGTYTVRVYVKDTSGSTVTMDQAGSVKVSNITYTSGNYTYELDGSGNATIVRFTGTNSSVSIPSSLDGHPVTGIGSTAFSGCNRLVNLTLPSTITTIADGAFRDCPTQDFSVSGGNSFCAVGGVLYSKDKSTLIRYPIKKAGDSFTVPDSVTEIKEYAFYSCSIESITIGCTSNVLSIAENAFASCTKLHDVYVRANSLEILTVSEGNSYLNNAEWHYN